MRFLSKRKLVGQLRSNCVLLAEGGDAAGSGPVSPLHEAWWTVYRKMAGAQSEKEGGSLLLLVVKYVYLPSQQSSTLGMMVIMPKIGNSLYRSLVLIVDSFRGLR